MNLSVYEFDTLTYQIISLIMEHEKIDTHQMEDANDSTDGAPLGRQMTITLSAEQYERMFFQPSGPSRGDLAKRFGMLWINL